MFPSVAFPVQVQGLQKNDFVMADGALKMDGELNMKP
jgi:hypothetical protein